MSKCPLVNVRSPDVALACRLMICYNHKRDPSVDHSEVSGLSCARS